MQRLIKSFVQVQLIEPAVVGTKNVLNSCVKAKVKRVVVVSSVGAVMLNPNWPKGQVMDEECWSDEEFCEATEVSKLTKFHMLSYHGLAFIITPELL